MLDESGSIRKKNTARPPYINDLEWRAFDKKMQTKLTADWKLSIQVGVDAEKARLAAPLIVGASSSSSGPPGEVIPPIVGVSSSSLSGASSSSSSAVPPHAAPSIASCRIVPAMCAANLDAAKTTFAKQILSFNPVAGDGEESDAEPEGFVAPAMPVIVRPAGYKPKHRPKIPDHSLPFPACVARPVRGPEIASNPAARAAMDLEFNKLRDKVHPGLSKKGAWDIDSVEELSSVKARAHRTGVTMHFGRIFGICVEKGSELPRGDKNRKFKGRYVFQGNEVKDQNWEAAIFQELGSSPAAMEAGNSCDFYGLLPGNRTEQSDAEQAYTQSVLKGTLTWVFLPKDRWPPAWVAAGYQTPVVPLRLALYGHPDAGGYWEQHCEAHLSKVGFVPSRSGALASGTLASGSSLWSTSTTSS